MNNAITNRLEKIGKEINRKLDENQLKCEGITIKITQWGDDIEINGFNETEQMTIKFWMSEGCDSPYKPLDYCEEITLY